MLRAFRGALQPEKDTRRIAPVSMKAPGEPGAWIACRFAVIDANCTGNV